MSSTMCHTTSPGAAIGRPGVPFAELVAPTRFVAEGILEVVWTVASGLAAFGSVLRRYLERRRNVAELQSLSDHTLKDIGMHRSMIRSVTYEIERGTDPRKR